MNPGAKVLSFSAATAGLITCLLCSAFCSTQQAEAVGEGVQWVDIPLDEAISRAKNENKRIFAEFTATWCSSCKSLDSEILSTKTGADLTSKLIAVRVDFDAEKNRRFVEQYVILGLPTVVVITPDGDQYGRVMGYEARESWLRDARTAIAAEDPTPALRAALAEEPSNPTALFQLGKALLVRGEAREGQALVERAIWAARKNHGDVAAAALFVLGRYHHRVKRDPATARHIWRELARHHPDSEYSGGAWWWYAKAQAELDRHDVGAAALLSWVERDPHNVDALSALGQFVGQHDLADHKVATRLKISSRLKAEISAEQRVELEEVLTKLRD